MLSAMESMVILTGVLVFFIEKKTRARNGTRAAANKETEKMPSEAAVSRVSAQVKLPPPKKEVPKKRRTIWARKR